MVRLAARPSCELLEWDSEHFGFPIARVSGSTLTPDGAEAVDEWCLDHGIRCLYFSARAGDAETARVAAGGGYRVVDVRIICRHSLKGLDQLPFTASEGMSVRDAQEEELDYLRRLAARSHRISRFYFDGGFARERCDALYEAWIERAFQDPQRTVRVPLIDGEPAGSHVLAPLDAERVGYAELVAVDERHRGRGVGIALHLSSLRLMAERGAVGHHGVHGVQSTSEIRLHERLGYLTERVEVWHHEWFDR